MGNAFSVETYRRTVITPYLYTLCLLNWYIPATKRENFCLLNLTRQEYIVEMLKKDIPYILTKKKSFIKMVFIFQ